MHMEMYSDFQSYWAGLENDEIDLVYANPYAASMLVRDKGFLPLVKADGISDETVVAVSAKSSIEKIGQLQSGAKIVSAISPGVHMMGISMLEPADLNEENTEVLIEYNFILVAKQLLNGNSDVGIFLAEAYDDFSRVLKKQLKVLVRSKIDGVHHSLMIGPKSIDKREAFRNVLLEMNADEKGQDVLSSLGFLKWSTVDDEVMEFMIDLMDTLTM